MSRDSRKKLIKEIEEERGSRLLVAVWGDRENLGTIIAPDAPAVFFKHLEKIGKVDRLDVLLYTVGGHTLAAWGLANLLREYCEHLCILIPHRALSSGTLLTLAADEIIMSRLGQLSPIDPSITSPLGPMFQLPNQPGQFQALPVSVEDVMGFIDLATKAAELKEERSILAVFDRLSSQVHPLALGAVYRSRQQIVSLADRLLSFHMKSEDDKDERDRIVTRLTREMGSHDYLIGRSEALTYLKLNVVEGSALVQQKMMDLFDEYSDLLSLRQGYNADGFLGALPQATGDFDRAIIETTDLTHVFRTTRDVQRMPMPGMPMQIGIQERTLSEGWLVDDNV